MAYDYREQYCPNKSTRGSYGYSSTPTGITIHWWGETGQQHQNVADYLCRSGGNSSAHEVISGGQVTHLVDFDMAAWHAGSTEGNGSTIGLECRPEMSAADMETVAQRCADIEIQLGRSMYYYGHRDWSATTCPGTWYDQIGWIINRVNEIKNGSGDEDMPLNEEDLHNVGLYAYRGVSNLFADMGLEDAHIRSRASNLRDPLGLDRLDKIITLIGEQNGVTAQDIADALTPKLSEELLPLVRNAIHDVLGEDNKAQAEAIVDALAQQLSSGGTES